MSSSDDHRNKWELKLTKYYRTRCIAKTFGKRVQVTYKSPRTTQSENLGSTWALVWLQNINKIPERVNGIGFTSAPLGRTERLRSCLHAHGVHATIWAPFPSGPSFPHMCQWVRRLSRVKPAVICGARSALRRWSCSDCERHCQRIHCLRKYNGRLNIHVQGKTTFISLTFQTKRGSRDGCFWQAKEEEDSPASQKHRQTSWNLKRGIQVVRADHRPGGGVGRWDGDGESLTMRRAFAQP